MMIANALFKTCLNLFSFHPEAVSVLLRSTSFSKPDNKTDIASLSAVMITQRYDKYLRTSLGHCPQVNATSATTGTTSGDVTTVLWSAPKFLYPNLKPVEAIYNRHVTEELSVYVDLHATMSLEAVGIKCK